LQVSYGRTSLAAKKSNKLELEPEENKDNSAKDLRDFDINIDANDANLGEQVF
jgi:hypothetical protein